MDIDELWNHDDPAASESRFRAALAETRDAALRAELLTQIARAQGLQGHFDAAHLTLDQTAAATSPDMTRARVRILLERGRALNSSGRRAEARPFFAEAYELGRAAGEDNRRGPQDDGGIRIAKWCVARELRALGRVEEALACQRALLAELDRASERDGYVFEEIGECLRALGREGEAEPYFARPSEALAR
jgi:tetratricopeptide (TPR) repeat protein